jgi:hypothetical protein
MKKIKQYILLFTLFCVHFCILAQTEVKVHLDNGGVLVGELLDISETGDLTLKMRGDQLLTIKSHLIRKYYANGSMEKPGVNPENDPFLKKYKFHTEGSLLIGDMDSGYGVKQIINYKLINSLYTGLSIGVDNYSGNAELNVYSIGADTRYYFSRLPKHPFVSFNAGYGTFHALQKFNQTSSKGGMYWNPSAGFSFGSIISFDVSLGLRFQNSDIKYQLNETESEIKWNYRRITLSLGVTF